MRSDSTCELIKTAADLERAIKEKDSVFVLFYASWCPFSRKFLPEFIENSGKTPQCHIRVQDDDEELAEKYNIEVFPTVLYFEKGRLVKRLDGVHMRGLNKDQLKEFAENCSV